jgi:CubicO group peptidase (beta-lactamase class C family)
VKARRFLAGMSLTLLLASCTPGSVPSGRASKTDLRALEDELDALRQEYQIPGMSVAVVHRQKVVLARGYGYADLENQVPATVDTPYNIASCTKPIAATVLMVLVEEGQLDLDAPMAGLLADAVFPMRVRGEPVHGYAEMCATMAELAGRDGFPLAPLFADYGCDHARITVRHHLTHTAQGVPGQAYRYNGFLYGWLSLVAEEASGRSFADLVVETITAPLDMRDTLPNPDPGQREWLLAARTRYYRVAPAGGYELSRWPSREFVELIRMIDPDAVASEGQPDALEGQLDAAAGIITTVRDLAKFDVAMDRNQIVSQASKEAMFTPARSDSGQSMPYGLGWFVQEHQDVKLVWHYGWAPYAYSSLILKVPEQEVTLILLANSDGASASFDLGTGDVLTSPFAGAFLRHLTDIEIPGA